MTESADQTISIHTRLLYSLKAFQDQNSLPGLPADPNLLPYTASKSAARGIYEQFTIEPIKAESLLVKDGDRQEAIQWIATYIEEEGFPKDVVEAIKTIVAYTNFSAETCKAVIQFSRDIKEL